MVFSDCAAGGFGQSEFDRKIIVAQNDIFTVGVAGGGMHSNNYHGDSVGAVGATILIL